jgi:hypothetical protein
VTLSTDDLIDRLSNQAGRAPRHLAAKRLTLGIAPAVVLSAVVMVIWLGVRTDMAEAVNSPPFWIKFGYTFAIAVLMAWMLERVGRPGARLRSLAFAGVVPPGVLIILALAQLATTPGPVQPMIMGGTADLCPWRIVVLSLPMLAGALWALKGLAPTRPALAGAVAGLCAGGAGAFVYAFHCGESAMPFVAVWYSLGVILTGMIGALIGSRLLRW